MSPYSNSVKLKNALTLLQPVSKEMGDVFEQFKGITGSLVDYTMKEAPKKFDRYIRKTLVVGCRRTCERVQRMEK
jgi:hypothetical protein